MIVQSGAYKSIGLPSPISSSIRLSLCLLAMPEQF